MIWIRICPVANMAILPSWYSIRTEPFPKVLHKQTNQKAKHTQGGGSKESWSNPHLTVVIFHSSEYVKDYNNSNIVF